MHNILFIKQNALLPIIKSDQVLQKSDLNRPPFCDKSDQNPIKIFLFKIQSVKIPLKVYF